MISVTLRFAEVTLRRPLSYLAIQVSLWLQVQCGEKIDDKQKNGFSTIPAAAVMSLGSVGVGPFVSFRTKFLLSLRMRALYMKGRPE